MRYAHQTRRPLVGFAVIYALGLHGGYESNVPFMFALFGAGIALCLAWATKEKNKVGFIYVALLFIALLQAEHLKTIRLEANTSDRLFQSLEEEQLR